MRHAPSPHSIHLPQDPDNGGIADRPEDMADVWHTVFGLAGMSFFFSSPVWVNAQLTSGYVRTLTAQIFRTGRGGSGVLYATLRHQQTSTSTMNQL